MHNDLHLVIHIRTHLSLVLHIYHEKALGASSSKGGAGGTLRVCVL